jgi:hypothetical protein
MKKSYDNMQEFIDDLMTPEMIKERRENFRDFQGDMETEFDSWEFQSMVSDIGRYSSYRHKDVDPPFNVPEYYASSDTDHDHGAWADEYIIETEGRFYLVEFWYYGQGDYDIDHSKWYKVKEVFPKTITKVIYE